ncbi:MAG: AraC family transcriptional regulator [Oscillospiraceae bacterium]|nr:AraC family transcriptional regulator [Oscillospiraceae bacterium]
MEFDFAKYPMRLEKLLVEAISKGDETLAKEILNILLVNIYYYSQEDLSALKTRALELVVLLSRSAIDRGADDDEVLKLNNTYFETIQTLSNFYELNVWFTAVLENFLGYMLNFKGLKHTHTIAEAKSYIRENCGQKLTIEDIAHHVYLSKSYLSRIFKEETGDSLTAYINKVRIEKSIELLADKSLSLIDISDMAGFEEQSYFTKVFKSVTGDTPAKYRSKVVK